MNFKPVDALQLNGRALNWAVTKCEETEVMQATIKKGAVGFLVKMGGFVKTDYVNNWAHGGPVMESHIEEFHREPNGSFWAATSTHSAAGATLLIASMRARVMSKLGMMIEIPEELVD